VIFTTFHIMVLMGMLLLGLGFTAAWLLYRKKLYETKWFLKAVIFCLPAPFIAFELGWIGTEIGRQPWMIYNILKTVNSTTLSVDAAKVIITLSILSVIYTVIAVIFIIIIKNIIKKGPEEIAGEGHKDE
jgi:cytochrome d ubiquinol oxidase subunit I